MTRFPPAMLTPSKPGRPGISTMATRRIRTFSGVGFGMGRVDLTTGAIGCSVVGVEAAGKDASGCIGDIAPAGLATAGETTGDCWAHTEMQASRTRGTGSNFDIRIWGIRLAALDGLSKALLVYRMVTM